MTPTYKALLERFAVETPASVDLVRQRLTGSLGVNQGDYIRFSTELIQNMAADTKGSEPMFHTVTLRVSDVRFCDDGRAKLIVLALTDGSGKTTATDPSLVPGRRTPPYGVITGIS